ncbi:MAG: NAD(+)/NADH kinase [Planctomycetota bacterium]|nr:NAD(+)/NADH kinase [Planctomycetota bacterium]
MGEDVNRHAYRGRPYAQMSLSAPKPAVLKTVQLASPITRVVIFVNPIAGSGKGHQTAERLQKHLLAANIQAQTIYGAPESAPTEQLTGSEAIITIGGDGTLRAAVQRCMDVLGQVPPVLPVPLGTANLMCRHLGIDWAPPSFTHHILLSLQRGTISYLDVAEANGQLFLLMVGVGLDGSVVHELDRIRGARINFASYLLPAAMALTNYRYPPIDVRIDGKEIFACAPALAFIGNVKEYGTGFPLLPEAQPDDGLLDVCVIPIKSPVELIQKFIRVAAGEHLLEEGVVYARGHNITVNSTTPIPIQLDGDPGGHTPVLINLLPVRVPFIVPA